MASDVPDGLNSSVRASSVPDVVNAPSMTASPWFAANWKLSRCPALAIVRLIVWPHIKYAVTVVVAVATDSPSLTLSSS